MFFSPIGSVKFIQTKSESHKKTYKTKNTNVKPLPLAGTYDFNARLDDGPHCLASLIRKPSYWVQISIGFRSGALLTVANILYMGAGPNLINKEFLPQGGMNFIKSIKSPQLRALCRQVGRIEGILPLFTQIGDLRYTHGMVFLRILLLSYCSSNSILGHRLMRTRDILYRAKNFPFAFEASGDYFDENSD